MSEKTDNKIPNVPNLRFEEFTNVYKKEKFGTVISLRKDKYNPLNEFQNFPCIELESIESNSCRLLEIFKAKNQKSLKTKFLKGDVLFGKLRPYLRKFLLPEFDGVCSTEIWALNSHTLLNNYLFYYIQTDCFMEIANTSSGTKMPRAEWSLISNINIKYPDSKEEMEKISSFLTKIEARIGTQNKIIEDLKTYKKRILHEIYYSLESQNRVILNEICTITTGKLDANAMNPNGKYKFFTCAKEDYYIDTFSFDGESLIISGNGEVGLIKYFDGKFDAYQRTYILQNFLVNPLYIKFALEIELPKKIYKEKNVGAMPYIVLSTLSNITIKIPNEDTITKISNLVVSIDKKIAVEEQILNDYKSQKEYLLSNMFI